MWGYERNLKILAEVNRSKFPNQYNFTYHENDLKTIQTWREGNIEESKFTKEKMLSLIVEDTGIGITSQDQAWLFRLFGKLSSNHNRNKTGWGLGLTICKKIWQKLGGDITLESKEGMGTRVECSFIWKY